MLQVRLKGIQSLSLSTSICVGQLTFESLLEVSLVGSPGAEAEWGLSPSVTLRREVWADSTQVWLFKGIREMQGTGGATQGPGGQKETQSWESLEYSLNWEADNMVPFATF